MSAPDLPLQENEPAANVTLEAEFKQINSDLRKSLNKMNTKEDTKSLWVAIELKKAIFFFEIRK